jgi:hypothetical protein
MLHTQLHRKNAILDNLRDVYLYTLSHLSGDVLMQINRLIAVVNALAMYALSGSKLAIYGQNSGIKVTILEIVQLYAFYWLMSYNICTILFIKPYIV